MILFLLLFFLINTIEFEEAYDDDNYDDNTYIEPDLKEKTKNFNTKTFEGRIAKYYYDREMINDEDWKERIGRNFNETYIIEAGDTLWAISEKFLDSPYYWPKIWALNPYITNPHLIYPGNEIKFKFYAEDIPELMIGELDISEEAVISSKNLTDYTVLEKELKPSLYDDLGFFKIKDKSYRANALKTVKNNYSFYLASNIEILGRIINLDKKIPFKQDFLNIQKNKDFDCKTGTYSLLNKNKNIYTVAGILAITDTNKCSGTLNQIYSPINSNTILTKLISLNYNSPAVKSQKSITATIMSENKDLLAEGDTVYLFFSKETPNINDLLFFYENHNLIGIAKTIFVDKNYITAIITAANKPITKKHKVST